MLHTKGQPHQKDRYYMPPLIFEVYSQDQGIQEWCRDRGGVWSYFSVSTGDQICKMKNKLQKGIDWKKAQRTLQNREPFDPVFVALQGQKLSKYASLCQKGGFHSMWTFNKGTLLQTQVKSVLQAFVCSFCDCKVAHNWRSWKDFLKFGRTVSERLYDACLLGVGRDWVDRKQTCCAAG